MMHPAETTRPNRCVGVKSESVTKGRSNIGIRCPPREADWEFGETVCSNKLVDQHSFGVVAPRAFLTSFCRNPGSRSKLAIPCRSVAELLDCSAANSELSGQRCAPKDRSQKRPPSSHALWHRSPNDQ
jgi:hypothetical protein